MKKIIVFAFAALCILGSFTACKGADVSMTEPALTASSWGNEQLSFSFRTGRVVATDVHEDGVSHTEEGNYKMNGDGVIEVYWDKHYDNDLMNMLYYSYENGELKLFTDIEMKNELVKSEK